MIILPAGILAMVGLWSLQQDRVVAVLAAKEQAQRLADRLVQRQLPGALQVGVGALAGFESGLWRVGDPAEDPGRVFSSLSIPRVAWRFDRAGQLVYPPVPQTPQPFDLDASLLSSAQRDLWRDVQIAMHEQPDTLKAITALEAMREQALPETWQVNTLYLLGVRNLELGLDAAAVEAFEQALAFVGVGATGDWMRRLQQYSRVRLLELTIDQPEFARSRRAWIDGLGTTALNRPTTLDAPLLSSLAETALFPFLPVDEQQRLEDWRGCLDQRSQALELAALADPVLPFRRNRQEDAPGPFEVVGWVESQDATRWLLTVQADVNGVWVFALDHEAAHRLVTDVLSTVSGPEWFGYSVRLSGDPLEDVPSEAMVLADASRTLAAGELASALQATVYLEDPNAFYARQRMRTYWFGGLIGCSLVTVALGIAAAWRAFHRQQQLNEMKTNFVSSVTHELRAPIASVRLMAEELQASERGVSTRAQGYHRMIVQECLRLSALIENVLDLTRHDQGRRQFEFEPTDVRALLRETVNVMHCVARERKVSITLKEPIEEITWELDGRSIQQTLVNLIDNAVKHSPNGSVVEVGARIDPRPALAETENTAATSALESLPTRSQLRLSVQDAGEGIPASEHARIFDRFYRRGSELRRETTGVGIGLTIVRQVVEAHDGAIELKSEVGEGSCFTLVLPEREHHGENPNH